MKHLKELPILCLSIFWLSCSKNNGAGGGSSGRDTLDPLVTIVTPVDNQPVSAGNLIRIHANGSDNVKLSQLHIHVTNKIDGAILRDVHSYPGQTTGSVKDSFTAAAGMTYIIKIQAYDPSQNLGTAQVEVPVN